MGFMNWIRAFVGVCLLAALLIPTISYERQGQFFESDASATLAKPVLRSLSQIPISEPRTEAAAESEEIFNAGEREYENRLIQRPDRLSGPEPPLTLQNENPLQTTVIAPPSLQATFPGIACTGRGQPDSIVAVGPSRVLLAVNTKLDIYTKTGQKKFETSFDSWFSSLTVAAGSNLFDPRLIYDAYDGHFIFTVTARRRDNRSWILLSVSKTNDPEGQWAFYALDMQLNGANRVTLWADFPRLGIDDKAIYLTADMSTFRTFLFRYAKLRILKKSEVYAFGNIGWHDIWKLVDASGKYAIHVEPAHSFGTVPAEYLVNTRNDSGNLITLWTLQNPTAAHPKLTKTAVKVAAYAAPPFALQRGGGTVLVAATEGTGVLKVVSRNGFVYASHAIAHNWGSGPVSAIRFYQVNTTGKVIQQVTYGSNGTFYYMPTVMVNSAGDVALAFNRSSASQFAGIFFAGRKVTDPLRHFSKSVPLHPGQANYDVIFPGSNIDHWGDYNGIAVDQDDSFWVYGEYVLTPTLWGTQLGKVAY